MEEQDKWIRGVRSKLQDHSEPIPAGLWEKLEQELQLNSIGEESMEILPNVIPMWRRWQSIAAVVAMLVVSTATLFFWEYSAEESLQQANLIQQELWMEGEAAVSAPKSEANLSAGQKVVATTTEAAPKGAVGRTNLSSSAQLNSNQSYTAQSAAGRLNRADYSISQLALDQQWVVADEQVSNQQSVVAEQMVDNQDSVVIDKPSMTEQPVQNQYASERKKSFFTAAVVQKPQKATKQRSLVLAMGNMPSSSTEAFGGYKRLQADGLQGMNFNLPTSDGGATLFPDHKIATKESALSAVMINNIANNEVYTDVKHHAPLTFGASMRFQISKNWGVETGLTYTLLQSDLRGGSNESYYEENQRLHYIGIPLRINRTIWSNRSFELYASAGGAIEKSVSGRLKTTYTVDNREEVTHVESLSIKELQFSLAATLGAQYKVTEQMGFYLEPGMVYYFNDGSNIETIRKEHPYNFNLQLGFRVDF